MAINLHEKYAGKVVERFHLESLTQSSFSKSLDMEFTGVKTVKVSSINTVAMNDYDRTTSGNRYGTPGELQDTIQEFTMTKDRSFTFIIDKGNNMEQQMIKKAGQAIARQLREVVTPEIDTYRFSVWAANAGETATVTAPTKSTILEQVVNAKMALDNKKVPQKGRTLYVGSTAYKALLTCTEYIALDKLGSKTLVNGKVGEIMGMDVKFIPDTYLPANVQYMLIYKDAAISPVKLHEYKIHKDPPGISGHLCEGRFIYDAFVIDAKKDGIYVAKTA